MHQPIARGVDDLKADLMEAKKEYRAAVKWARFALDYKKSFEKEEDFGQDNLRDYIEFLKKDSREELKTVAIDIKRLKSRIKTYQECLIDLSKGKK